MKTLKFCAAFALLATLLLPLRTAQAVTVYEPANGLPGSQGWSLLSLGNAGTASAAAGVLSLDSSGSGVDSWGFARFSPVALDAHLGYSVDFSLRVLQESHANANRGGFSLLLVGSQPSQAIEIAFWTDRLFAYEYVNGAFVQGTGALLDTQSAARSYQLQVQGGQYSLSSNGQTLFGGLLQNYTPQGLPYTLPNLVFFGDNTSSASARVELGALAISPVPEPASAAMALAGLVLLGAYLRQRRAV